MRHFLIGSTEELAKLAICIQTTTMKNTVKTVHVKPYCFIYIKPFANILDLCLFFFAQLVKTQKTCINLRWWRQPSLHPDCFTQTRQRGKKERNSLHAAGFFLLLLFLMPQLKHLQKRACRSQLRNISVKLKENGAKINKINKGPKPNNRVCL